jgi:hypothetical protein
MAAASFRNEKAVLLAEHASSVFRCEKGPGEVWVNVGPLSECGNQSSKWAIYGASNVRPQRKGEYVKLGQNASIYKALKRKVFKSHG